MVHKFVKPVAGSVIAFAMCFSSTAASAASLPTASAFAPASINPFVALSAYGTVQSQAAVCAAAGTAAATAANGQPAAGCVLPVVDPVAVAPVVDAAPVALAPVGGGFGLGVGAILAGLIAVAGLAAVLLSSNGKGRLPVTPD